MSFYEVSGEDLKSELPVAITKSTRLGQLFDDAHVGLA